MLPEPTFDLTIPSIHDGTAIDCRIYHPASLAVNPRAPPWRRHAVVFAHPYAPLGGCYDDPLVDAAATQLLRQGFLLGTFNFRGAGHSAGRTSWNAKPERDDYISFVGFMVYYAHHLDPFHQSSKFQNEATGDVATEAYHGLSSEPRQPPVLLMAGYSYGAMITTQLPPLDEVVDLFKSPESGSNIAQIRLRAESLAEQQNLVLGEARAALLDSRVPSSPIKHGVRLGGGEGCGSPRKSHDSQGRRSFSFDAEEKLRRGVSEILAKRRSGRFKKLDKTLHTDAEEPKTPPANGKLPQVDGLLTPKPAYLLISPLQGLITHLATMSLVPSALSRQKPPQDKESEAKLAQNPTMAIFGDGDVFVPAGKLRAWTSRLSSHPSSQFRGHEIESAGHFWGEEGVLFRMLDLVNEFAGKLLDGR